MFENYCTSLSHLFLYRLCAVTVVANDPHLLREKNAINEQNQIERWWIDMEYE